MIIPFEQLDQDTLYNLIESYVLREGTDYGEVEASIESKVSQVKLQLKNGEAMVFFSELHESVRSIQKLQVLRLNQTTVLDALHFAAL